MHSIKKFLKKFVTDSEGNFIGIKGIACNIFCCVGLIAWFFICFLAALPLLCDFFFAGGEKLIQWKQNKIGLNIMKYTRDIYFKTFEFHNFDCQDFDYRLAKQYKKSNEFEYEKLLKNAAAMGSCEAQLAMAEFYFSKGEPVRGGHYLHRSAEDGYLDGKLEYAVFLLANGNAGDRDQAFRLLEACANSDLADNSCRELARCIGYYNELNNGKAKSATRVFMLQSMLEKLDPIYVKARRGDVAARFYLGLRYFTAYVKYSYPADTAKKILAEFAKIEKEIPADKLSASIYMAAHTDMTSFVCDSMKVPGTDFTVSDFSVDIFVADKKNLKDMGLKSWGGFSVYEKFPAEKILKTLQKFEQSGAKKQAQVPTGTGR